MTSENAVEVKVGTIHPFSYSVQWIETQQVLETRFEKFLDNGFFEHQIHWFSVLNSSMLVIFLLGLVALILIKTLKKDYSFSDDDGDDGDDEDDEDDEDDDSTDCTSIINFK